MKNKQLLRFLYVLSPITYLYKENLSKNIYNVHMSKCVWEGGRERKRERERIKHILTVSW